MPPPAPGAANLAPRVRCIGVAGAVGRRDRHLHAPLLLHVLNVGCQRGGALQPGAAQLLVCDRGSGVQRLNLSWLDLQAHTTAAKPGKLQASGGRAQRCALPAALHASPQASPLRTIRHWRRRHDFLKSLINHLQQVGSSGSGQGQRQRRWAAAAAAAAGGGGSCCGDS